MADATYQPAFYVTQGGDGAVVANGGTLTVESGGTQTVQNGGAVAVNSGGSVDMESGSSFKLAGTAVTATADEVNGLDVSVTGAGRKYKVLTLPTMTGSEQTSTWTFPALCVVHNVWLDVITAETTGSSLTLNVGTHSTAGGATDDADGFLVGVSVATAGVVRGKGTWDAGKFWSANTLGELLATYTVGTTATAPGTWVQHPGVVVGAPKVSYTAGGADWTKLSAKIVIEYTEIA